MSEIGRVYPLGSRQVRQARVPESHLPESHLPESHLPEHRAPEPGPPEPLWREVLGRRLRSLRTDRDETLAQTAERAGISPQYLSEIERGRKEASSEMIAALAGALGISVAGLMADTAQDLRRAVTMLRAVSTPAGRAAVGRHSASPAVITRSRQRPAGPVALARAA